MLKRYLARLKRWWLEYRLGTSPAFDAAFYQQQISGSSKPFRSRAVLWRHYLKEGGSKGLDPNPEFDSDWYLATYSDVVRVGLNPLVHYELYGKREGRAPRLGAHVFMPNPPVLDARTYWYFRLWGGFEHLVLPELEQKAERGDNTARWLLAEWAYAHADTDTARNWLQQIIGAEAPQSERERNAWNKLNISGPVAPATTKPAGPPSNATEYLVSVIVPTYNSAKHLPRMLESLLAQTWHNLEIIVVDDASTDDTAEVVGGIARDDRRVRYLSNECNMGAYPSRNRGMRAAQGDFVTVHDADDWSFPEKIEIQLQPLLNNPGLVATGSVWMRVTEDARPVGSWMLGEPFLEPNHSAWLVRRKALETVGLWDGVNVAADTEFLWRLEHHYGHKALHIVCPDQPLSLALSDESTLTRTKATHVRTVFYGLRRIYREASNWWHRSSGFKPVMADERPFPVPLGNLKNPPRQFDVVVAGNFAVVGQTLKRLLASIEAHLAKNESICLLHWPDYNAWHGNPIADEVFELAQAHGLTFAHSGFALTAHRVVLLDEALWHFPPTHTVEVSGLSEVLNREGQPCTEQEALKAYFKRGGVEQ